MRLLFHFYPYNILYKQLNKGIYIMSENEKSDSSGYGGGGCILFIIFILMITSICCGLSIGKSKWNIDIFPTPRIWDMNEEVQTLNKGEIKK